jgi:hypothetical protein
MNFLHDSIFLENLQEKRTQNADYGDILVKKADFSPGLELTDLNHSTAPTPLPPPPDPVQPTEDFRDFLEVTLCALGGDSTFSKRRVEMGHPYRK